MARLIRYLLTAGLFLVLLPPLASADMRIVGGWEVRGDSRGVGALVEDRASVADGQYCGVTLVRPRWALTAAHCLSRAKSSVVLRRKDLRFRGGERLPVIGSVAHPGYKRKTLSHDLALLYLGRRASGRPRRVLSSPPPAGARMRLQGWGQTSFWGPASPRLLEVSLYKKQNALCHRSYGDFYRPSSMLCAGGARDACMGDSGGALLWRGRVAGVVSFGRGCGEHPGVYARVDRGWIRKAISAGPPPNTRPRKQSREKPYSPLAFAPERDIDGSGDSYWISFLLHMKEPLQVAQLEMPDPLCTDDGCQTLQNLELIDSRGGMYSYALSGEVTQRCSRGRWTAEFRDRRFRTISRNISFCATA